MERLIHLISGLNCFDLIYFIFFFYFAEIVVGLEMEEADGPGFGSPEEELRFWKDQAARNKQRLGPASGFKPLFFFMFDF